MDIFISWSGIRSQKVAELLKNWLKCVIQASKPWISTHDIDRGALWFPKIAEALSETKFGIICLTQENKNHRWILFEAGAIAKGISENHVCTLLIDLSPTDVENPLAQFNHTIAAQKESMWELVKTINKELRENLLSDSVLADAFNTYWPKFEKPFTEILAEEIRIPIKRNNEDILVDILSTVRAVDKQLRQVEIDNQFVRDRFRREKLKELMREEIEFVKEDEAMNRQYQEIMQAELEEDQSLWGIENP